MNGHLKQPRYFEGDFPIFLEAKVGQTIRTIFITNTTDLVVCCESMLGRFSPI